jgi:hypothetical protein
MHPGFHNDSTVLQAQLITAALKALWGDPVVRAVPGLLPPHVQARADTDFGLLAVDSNFPNEKSPRSTM